MNHTKTTLAAIALIGLAVSTTSAQMLANPYHAIIGSSNSPTSNDSFKVSVHPSNPSFSGQGNVGSGTVIVNETFDHPIIG